jgi:hypothetical protein
MKYKIINKNKMSGGKIPKINIPFTEGLSKTERTNQMNITGPLYFNLNKNPIISEDDTIYNYDFAYKPDSNVLQMDNNLNLNPTTNNIGDIQSIEPIDPTNKLIFLNNLEIPYYLGKIHTNKTFFGNIKFLFQYVQINQEESDPQKRVITLQQEDDVIKFINSLFNISDEGRFLIGINQRLENQIDKFIFINKFYELLDMITWQPPDISEENIRTFRFVSIPTCTINIPKEKLKKILQDDNIIELIKLYSNSKSNYTVQFCEKYLDDKTLGLELKIRYIQMLLQIDHVLTKLKSIFTSDTDDEPDKINLINLLDLYKGYNSVFLSETTKNSNENTLICKNLASINKINLIVRPEYNKILSDVVSEIFEIKKVCLKITNWPIAYDIDEYYIKLDMILLLSYFDLRVNSTQIKKGKNLNALPINKVRAYENLLGNNKSIDITDQELIETETFLSNQGVGPEINTNTPQVNLTDEFGISFPACVENTLFQLVKFLFWDYDNESYDLNKMNLQTDNYFRSIMEEFVKTEVQNEQILREFVKPIIGLPKIDYMKKSNGIDYELNALSENIVKLLTLGLKNSIQNIYNIKNNGLVDYFNSFNDDLEFINKTIQNNNYELEYDNTNNNESKLILKYKGDAVLILTMNPNMHGDVSKPKKENFDFDLINSSVKNFYFYLNSYHDANIRYNYNYDPEFELLDVKQFINTNGQDSPYFNSDKIYWLNFIDSIDNFVNVDKIPNMRRYQKDDIMLYCELVLNVIDNIFTKTYTKNNIYIVNYNYKLLYDYLKAVIKFPIKQFSKSYNNLTSLLSTYPKSLELKPEIQYDFNVVQLMSALVILCNTEGLIHIINKTKSINNDILFKYNSNGLQPINLLLKQIFNNNNLRDDFFNYNNFVSLVDALIDKDQNVLKFIQENDLQVKSSPNYNEITSLPLYNILNNLKFIFEKLLDNNRLSLEELSQIINLFVDKHKSILDMYDDINPLSYYITTIDIEFIYSGDKYLYSNNDIYLKVPISVLQTENNIIIQHFKHTNSLLYKFIYAIYYYKELNYRSNKAKAMMRDNLLIDYFVENKLLIDPKINGNQPVFNMRTNYNDPSLLYMYVQIISKSDNFNCNTFKYLYNKELLIMNPTPLSCYIEYNGINCDINIIRLLAKEYNGISPLSINSKKFLRIIRKIKEDIYDYIDRERGDSRIEMRPLLHILDNYEDLNIIKIN